jgi:ribosomal protein S19
MRSSWKFTPSTFSLLKTVDTSLETKLSFFTKNLPILPSLVGRRIWVYNGRIFFTFLVRNYIVGFKFGIFLLTKKGGSGIHNSVSKKAKKTK